MPILTVCAVSGSLAGTAQVVLKVRRAPAVNDWESQYCWKVLRPAGS